MLFYIIKKIHKFLIFIDNRLQGNPYCLFQQHDNYNYYCFCEQLCCNLLSLVHTIALNKSDLGQMRSIIFLDTFGMHLSIIMVL
jgi:hypothetical protein